MQSSLTVKAHAVAKVTVVATAASFSLEWPQYLPSGVTWHWPCLPLPVFINLLSGEFYTV